MLGEACLCEGKDAQVQRNQRDLFLVVTYQIKLVRFVIHRVVAFVLTAVRVRQAFVALWEKVVANVLSFFPLSCSRREFVLRLHFATPQLLELVRGFTSCSLAVVLLCWWFLLLFVRAEEVYDFK